MYINEAFESEMSMDVKAPIGATSQRYVFLKANGKIDIVKYSTKLNCSYVY